MLVNQTLLYSISNNTNNIQLKLCKNGFNAVWKKSSSGVPTLPYSNSNISIFFSWKHSFLSEEVKVAFYKFKILMKFIFIPQTFMG